MKWLKMAIILTLCCGVIYGSPTDYPFTAIDVPDPWSFLTRECTSYAAWYWNAELGRNWYNTQPGRGSARYWDEIARTLGYNVVPVPERWAFVVWRGPLYAGDQWGHVAVVEAVNADGSIDISEMNWIRYSYSYRSGVHPGDYSAYYYITPIPEPSTLLALCGGVVGLLAFRRRRK